MNISSVVKNIFKFILIFIVSVVVIGLVVMSAIMIAISKNFPDMNKMKLESMLQETSYIFDDEGNVSEKVQSGVDRTIVPIEQIPVDLKEAFIAIEDERFYEHGGVDVKRLFGALIHDIKVGAFEQGGSTINMQLSKNLLTSTEKSALRKITDIVYAIKLDKQLNKSDIMYAYLNTVFLGSNVNGVQAAAKAYFNKDVEETNLMESAIIAGITKYPSKYIPYTLSQLTSVDDLASVQLRLYPPETANFVPSAEQKAIYDQLLALGKIDYYENMMLKSGTLVAMKASVNEYSVQRGKVVLYKMLELGFINDSEYQEALNTQIVISFPPRNNRNISTYFNDKVKKETINILVKQGSTEEEANNILKFGGLKIYTTLNTKMQQILEKAFADDSNFPESYIDENGVLQPQAAMVVIDQYTGQVKAYIGGRGQTGSYIFDRADNPRQPGSAIKPLAVYLLALKDGMIPSTIIKDAPREDPTSPTGYWPKNIFDKYYGDQTMKFLISVSSNVAAVKTLESLAPTRIAAVNRSLDYLTQMGFKHLVRSSENPVANDENLSLALGGLTKGVTVLEMTSAYSGIANLGKQISPIFITKIVDSNDRVIYESQPQTFEMISEGKAYQMVDMLNGVVTSGNANGARLPNMPSAGKTGTTTDVKDVYFSGFTPYYTASVWIGADIPKELRYTSAGPTRLWGIVMKQINAELNLGARQFKTPTGNEPIEEQPIEAIDVTPDEPEIVQPNDEQLLDDIIFNGENGQGQINDNQTTEPQPAPQPSPTPEPQPTPAPEPAPQPTPAPEPAPVIDTGVPSAPPVQYEEPDQTTGGDTPIF